MQPGSQHVTWFYHNKPSVVKWRQETDYIGNHLFLLHRGGGINTVLMNIAKASFDGELKIMFVQKLAMSEILAENDIKYTTQMCSLYIVH